MGGVDGNGQDVVEVVGRALGDGLLRPGAGKGSVLHDQDVDLIAFPGEGDGGCRGGRSAGCRFSPGRGHSPGH